MKVTIDHACFDDSERIRRVHLTAFPSSENQVISTLAVELLSEETVPKTLSLIANKVDNPIKDNSIEPDKPGLNTVGHIAFSPVSIQGLSAIKAYILAPLAVLPDYQKKGIGTKLVNAGLRELDESGIDVTFVYGDPDYYGQFGFTKAVAENFIPPYSLQYPEGWLALNLSKEALPNQPCSIQCVTPLEKPGLW